MACPMPHPGHLLNPMHLNMHKDDDALEVSMKNNNSKLTAHITGVIYLILIMLLYRIISNI